MKATNAYRRAAATIAVILALQSLFPSAALSVTANDDISKTLEPYYDEVAMGHAQKVLALAGKTIDQLNMIHSEATATVAHDVRALREHQLNAVRNGSHHTPSSGRRLVDLALNGLMAALQRSEDRYSRAHAKWAVADGRLTELERGHPSGREFDQRTMTF